jgi:hypothetical protein
MNYTACFGNVFHSGVYNTTTMSVPVANNIDIAIHEHTEHRPAITLHLRKHLKQIEMIKV